MNVAELKTYSLWKATFGEPVPIEAPFDMMINILVRCLPPADPYTDFARPDLRMKKYLFALTAPNGELHQGVVEAFDRRSAMAMSWYIWVQAGLDMFKQDPTVKVSLLEIANA